MKEQQFPTTTHWLGNWFLGTSVSGPWTTPTIQMNPLKTMVALGRCNCMDHEPDYSPWWILVPEPIRTHPYNIYYKSPLLFQPLAFSTPALSLEFLSFLRGGHMWIFTFIVDIPQFSTFVLYYSDIWNVFFPIQMNSIWSKSWFSLKPVMEHQYFLIHQ